MEMICVGGSQGRDLSTGLRPGGGIKTMSMNDGPDLLESAIKHQMRGGVGTRIQFSLNGASSRLVPPLPCDGASSFRMAHRRA